MWLHLHIRGFDNATGEPSGDGSSVSVPSVYLLIRG